MTLKCSNPAFADDVSLITTSPYSLQRMVDIVYSYCRRWNIEINVKKSNILVFTKRKTPPIVGIMYGEFFIPQTTTVKHLGILQQSNLKTNERVNERIQKARKALFSMISQGIHPLGVNPLVSTGLYKKIILPTLLYGAELWKNLTVSEENQLNIFQHFLKKKIQG